MQLACCNQQKDGKKRIIAFYVPYPGNFGFIPSNMMDGVRCGDGDALGVLVLSQHSATQTILEVIPSALLNLIDKREIDSNHYGTNQLKLPSDKRGLI